MSLSEDLIDLWSPLLRNLDINFGAFAEEFVAALLAKLTMEEGRQIPSLQSQAKKECILIIRYCLYRYWHR
jgi:hypothetical protein